MTGPLTDLEDGVCFSFFLDALPELPDKVRIYQRVNNSGQPWSQIGLLTNTSFGTVKGVKTLLGNAIWLPENTGTYDVKAEALDAFGVVMESVERVVIVGNNANPVVAVISGPSSNPFPQGITFTVTASDPDGDYMGIAEFYDTNPNTGVTELIGYDKTPEETTTPGVFEFGDNILDLDGAGVGSFQKGAHDVTVKVIDSRGGTGETSTPYVVTIGAINARPIIDINSPADRDEFQVGDPINIDYTLTAPDGLGTMIDVRATNLSREEIVATDDGSGMPSFGQDLVVSTTGWNPGTHVLKVVARDGLSGSSYSKYVTVYLRDGTGQTHAEKLIDNIIVDDNTANPDPMGVQLFTGIERSCEEFSSGSNSGLGIDSGIIMTSGSATLWNNGNVNESIFEGDDNGFPLVHSHLGDLDLESRIITFDTNDAAILEFDVICTNGQLELEYQFGSEEYTEFVSDGSEDCYNDLFLVTIDGVPVSLLPDCANFVAPNVIHPELTPEDSQCGADAPPLNEHLYIDETELEVTAGSPKAQYDGFTHPLRIHAFVTPGDPYRVRIVIADVDGVSDDSFEDDRLDSGLFIKQGSIRTIQPTP